MSGEPTDPEPRKPHDSKRLTVPDGLDFEELVVGLLRVDPDEIPVDDTEPKG